MTLQEFCLLLVSIFTSAAGQFFLKKGALKLGQVSASNAVTHLLSIVTIPELMAGLACYGLGAMAYILLLTRVKLSIAAPSVALTYVLSVLIGYFIFQENIPISRGIGMSFIVAGVILVAWKQ